MRAMPGNVGNKIGPISGGSWERALSPRNKWLDHPNIRIHRTGLGAEGTEDESFSKADSGIPWSKVHSRQEGSHGKLGNTPASEQPKFKTGGVDCSNWHLKIPGLFYVLDYRGRRSELHQSGQVGGRRG